MLASAHHSLSESAGRLCPRRPRLADLRGRDVTAQDGHAASPVMVVNQAFVDRFARRPNHWLTSMGSRPADAPRRR